MSQALQLLVDGLVQGSRIALVAVGFSLIYGVAKTLHIAHGAIITVAAYLVWWVTAELGAGLGVAFRSLRSLRLLMGFIVKVLRFHR